MGVIVTEANQGGGLHGRMTMELKKVFFDEVKTSLKEKGFGEGLQNLRYNDLFTVVAGTSFGSLITIASSSINDKRPACATPHEIAQLIDDEAGKIFPYNKTFFGKLFNDPRQILGGLAGTPQYSNKHLKGVIQDLVGKDTYMSDIKHDVMLTMAQLHPSIDTLFAKSHLARGEKTAAEDDFNAASKDWLIWESALASASPTSIFPGVVMTNRAGDKTVGVIDGGQSGWNDCTIPVLAEATFMYGKKHDDAQNCLIVDSQGKGFDTPHEIIHLSWGTGDFHDSVPLDKVKKNTILAMGKHLATVPMQATHKYSLVIGQQQVEHFYRLDPDINDLPASLRPDADITLSSPEQMQKLTQAGIYAAQLLHEKIKSVANLVADAYIERKKFEQQNQGVSYKDYLKSDVCLMPS